MPRTDTIGPWLFLWKGALWCAIRKYVINGEFRAINLVFYAINSKTYAIILCQLPC